MLEAARREPTLKAQHAHPGACPVQPALGCRAAFPGRPDAETNSFLRHVSAGILTAVKPLQSQHRNEKTWKRREGCKKRRVCDLTYIPKTLSLINVQGSGGVTSPGATGRAGLWAFRVRHQRGSGQARGRWSGRAGGPFFPRPTTNMAYGGSCTVCVSPRPVCPGDRAEAQLATQSFPGTAGGGSSLF